MTRTFCLADRLGKGTQMSDNKMGGVPSKTRDALYDFFDAQRDEDDEDWAKIIRKITRLGPRKTMKKLGLKS